MLTAFLVLNLMLTVAVIYLISERKRASTPCGVKLIDADQKQENNGDNVLGHGHEQVDVEFGERINSLYNIFIPNDIKSEI